MSEEFSYRIAESSLNDAVSRTGRRDGVPSTRVLKGGAGRANSGEIVVYDGDIYQSADDMLAADGEFVPNTVTAAAALVSVPAVLALGLDSGGTLEPLGGAGATTAVEVSTTAAKAEAFGVHLEDDPHTTADPLVASGTVRQDTAAALGGTDGDYQPLITDATGHLWARLGANSGVDIGDVDVTSLTVSAAEAEALGVHGEDDAHAHGDPGSFVLTVRRDTPSALGLTEGDYQASITGSDGRLWVSEGTPTTIADTPTLDTSAYAADDVLHVAAEIANACITTAGGGTVSHITIIDDDDQHASGNAMDVLFFDATVSVTHNVALSLSDADADNYVGKVQIAAGDWADGTNNAIADVECNLQFDCAATSLFYVTVLRSGTPTHTASGMEFKFAITNRY